MNRVIGQDLFLDHGKILRFKLVFGHVVGVALRQAAQECVLLDVLNAPPVGNEFVDLALFAEAEIIARIAGGHTDVNTGAVAAIAANLDGACLVG